MGDITQVHTLKNDLKSSAATGRPDLFAGTIDPPGVNGS